LIQKNKIKRKYFWDQQRTKIIENIETYFEEAQTKKAERHAKMSRERNR